MTYNEWLDIIELIMKSNRNKTYLQKMIDAENNQNINELLKPKLVELITNKLTKSVKKIIYNLNDTFHNPNTLDLTITTFKKDLDYINQLCSLKQINEDVRKELQTSIIEETEKVYDILIKKSLEVDRTGMYKSIIEKKKNSKR